MIEMKKTQKAGETPAQITVSMVDQDLKDGTSKPEMAIKYGIKPWEVDEMFKHPFLKGRRPSRKKALSFSFIDDTEPLNNGDIAVEQAAEVDPNQVTLEDAIKEAIDTVEEVKEELKQTEEDILEILSPTDPDETIESLIYEGPAEITGIPNGNTMSDTDDEEVEILEEIEIKEDENSFEL